MGTPHKVATLKPLYFKCKLPQNGRCRGGHHNAVVLCAPLKQLVGHCQIQEARLDTLQVPGLIWGEGLFLTFPLEMQIHKEKEVGIHNYKERKCVLYSKFSTRLNREVSPQRSSSYSSKARNTSSILAHLYYIGLSTTAYISQQNQISVS